MLLRTENWYEIRNQVNHNLGDNKTRGKKTQKNYVLPPVNLTEKWIM